ncbi:MAG: N-acetylmuramoyl-L-alanine amidase [Clostridia bacterium]|nr:N-acetylmuramoyl-L-alanine amidase [Clostridia bacterium]
MKSLILLTVLSLICLLTGCDDSPTAPSITETIPESNQVIETSQTISTETIIADTAEKNETLAEETEYIPADTVSDLAEKDYLLPYEKYSWEREFDIEYVVLHFTSDVLNNPNNPHDVNTVKQIFEQSEISTHYIIDRNGKIKCFIPENYAAWHAGIGTFADDEKYTNKINKYSIGIEMLAIGTYNDMEQYLTKAEYDKIDKSFIGFTDEQYASLKDLLKEICERYSIPYDREHIIGHDEYNSNKSDPGELFDWDKLFE